MVLWTNAYLLRAGYRRHKSGLTTAGFREEPSRSDGVWLSASSESEGRGKGLSRHLSLGSDRCVRSGWIVEAGELAFDIVADFASDERMLTQS